MKAKVLFHPDHVVPAVEFIPAPVEFARHVKPQLFMKPDAVRGKVFIFFLRTGNAGVQVQDSLLLQNEFQGFIKPGAYAQSFSVRSHIDGKLRDPLISRPFMKDARIGISQNFSVRFRYQPGLFFLYAPDPCGKPLRGGNFIFKGNRRSCHIRRVKGQERLRIPFRCRPQADSVPVSGKRL